jgi:hypothetical protein
MFAAPERQLAIGAHTFSLVITTSVVEDSYEKIAGIDCMMH